MFGNDDDVGDDGCTVENVVGSVGDDDDDDYSSSRTTCCSMMMIYILQ